MKKYATGLYLFIVFFLVAVKLSVVASPVFAAIELAPPEQEGMMQITNGSPGADMNLRNRSEYILPYPGILHSHPLYFLKEFRDKIIETLIVDPVRKSDFYLLQGDKWLASVAALLSAQQTELAGRVLNQAADRMGMAVAQLAIIKKDGRQIPPGSLEKINSAIEKHLEVVDEFSIEKQIPTEQARASYLATQEALMKLR